MLYLIGLGLDIKDVSVKGLELIKSADRILLEKYTTPLSEEYLSWLRSQTTNAIELIERPALEERAKETIKYAQKQDLAVLVPGDPLIATTHHILFDIARANGIKAEVVHSSSIFSAAIGESGLDVYRFGPPTTIARWSAKYRPVSFLDVIRMNISSNQHSLILLDIDPDTKAPMALEDALRLLSLAEDERHYGIIKGQLPILILGNVGKADKLLAYTNFGSARGLADKFTGKTLTLIIPCNPNFAENEGLSHFAIA
ncbi:MAG: diphthine synthase [Candidatus Micrarchaeota archaeon]|nr:diphthine synthase [Candidatus Micrarchaeota archaeon]